MYSYGLRKNLVVQKTQNEKPMRYKIGANNYPIREIFSAHKVLLEDTFSSNTEELDVNTVDAWAKMLNSGAVSHEYSLYKGNIDKDYLLKELCLSDVYVPIEIMHYVYSDGRRILDNYKKLERMLSLCNNAGSLEFFLNKGIKFKHIKGCGNSTMESYFYPMKPRLLYIIAKYPESVDMKWIRKNKTTIMNTLFSLIKDGRDNEAQFVANLLLKV